MGSTANSYLFDVSGFRGVGGEVTYWKWRVQGFKEYGDIWDQGIKKNKRIVEHTEHPSEIGDQNFTGLLVHTSWVWKYIWIYGIDVGLPDGGLMCWWQGSLSVHQVADRLERDRGLEDQGTNITLRVKSTVWQWWCERESRVVEREDGHQRPIPECGHGGWCHFVLHLVKSWIQGCYYIYWICHGRWDGQGTIG